MNKENRHLLHLARAELNWFSVLANALNTETIKKVDWETAKKEFAFRGCLIDEDTEDIEGEHKQIDMFGSFVAFTLVCHNGYFGIGYGWALDDYNTDLYEWGVGDMRPYYDNESKKAFVER